MRRNEPRNDGLAGIVDNLGTAGNRGFGGSADGDDAPVTDDDGGVVERSRAPSIDHAGTAKGSGWGVRTLRCPDDERDSESAQRTEYPSAKHAEPSHCIG